MCVNLQAVHVQARVRGIQAQTESSKTYKPADLSTTDTQAPGVGVPCKQAEQMAVKSIVHIWFEKSCCNWHYLGMHCNGGNGAWHVQ